MTTTASTTTALDALRRGRRNFSTAHAAFALNTSHLRPTIEGRALRRFVRTWVLCSIAFCSLSLVATGAHAFCRTMTCEADGNCEFDAATGCAVSGVPLYWPTSCVSFAVEEGGVERAGFELPAVNDVIQDAFGRWTTAACAQGQPPSVEVMSLGSVSCDRVEYNTNAPNANTWILRDEGWDAKEPASGDGVIPSSALAATWVTFNVRTGEIYDADVEINSETAQLTLGDDGVVIDLASIVTHEAGHFLGLAHSDVAEATMVEGYPPGSTWKRTLEADDENAICAAYPPARATSGTADCVPRQGFAETCEENAAAHGCAFTAELPTGHSNAAHIALALGSACLLHRRTARRLTPLRATPRPR